MKKEKTIYYSNKYKFCNISCVDIIENVEGVDVKNYTLCCGDLIDLSHDPIFDDDKLKFDVKFVKADVEEL